MKNVRIQTQEPRTSENLLAVLMHCGTVERYHSALQQFAVLCSTTEHEIYGSVEV
jgi:hypothetical protein